MKNLLILIAFVALPLVTKAQQFPQFKWSETVHDFGKIKKGIPVTATFGYTNTGKAPLIITEAKGSCGCTVPEHTKESVAPGKNGKVTATFNAAGVGAFSKTVTVTSNVEGGPQILTIKGEVIE